MYELLTGSTPFEKDPLRKVGCDEMRRLIRKLDRLMPSDRLTSLGDRGTMIAENRRRRLRKLQQLAHGDLEWIFRAICRFVLGHESEPCRLHESYERDARAIACALT